MMTTDVPSAVGMIFTFLLSNICRQILYQLKHQGSPRIMEWADYPFSSRSSWPRNRTRVSCIAGRFFTSWATREAHAFMLIVVQLLSRVWLSAIEFCHGQQHARVSCPSLSPRVCWNSCPLSRWCLVCFKCWPLSRRSWSIPCPTQWNPSCVW